MDRSEIDDIQIECGNDRFHIELDGHYRRFLYRLSLEFNVLECRIGQEKYLHYVRLMSTLTYKSVMVVLLPIGLHGELVILVLS